MNDEMFRLALIDITNADLLNDFVNDIFGYDFDLRNEEYVYIQYKIVEDNIILNIYDNKNIWFLLVMSRTCYVLLIYPLPLYHKEIIIPV